MFEYSFVPDGQTHRPWLVAVAGLGEAILISSLVVIPLLFVQALPERGLLKALMLAPVPSAPPAPPPPMLAKAIPHTAPPPRKFNADALVSPVVVPKVVAIISEAPPAEMEAMAGGVPGGIPGGALPGIGTGFFSNAISLAPPPPPPLKAAAPTPSAAPAQITVGGDVQAGLIIDKIPPVYPQLARVGHIRGTVMLRAIIGTDGKVKSLTASSGNPLLVEAAMSAVKHWTYHPTLLNGVPVEVKTDIEVNFKLSS
jgi:protein TonB